MKAYTITILDRMTEIRALAIPMIPEAGDVHDTDEAIALARDGYGPSHTCVMLLRLRGGESAYDPYAWGDRTMTTTHVELTRMANAGEEFSSGLVLDVRKLLGEVES